MYRNRLSHTVKVVLDTRGVVFFGVVLVTIVISLTQTPILRTVQANLSSNSGKLHVCTEIPPSSFDATGRPDLFWKNRDTIKVRFLDGSPILKAQVRKYSEIWSRYAKIRFEFTDSIDCDIRISFTPDGTSWSFVGTDASSSSSDTTMNFGWFTDETSDVEFRRTILHEFGHALGLVHEHQSPVAGIQWNKPVVYKYYWDNFRWSEGRVDRNIFEKYLATQTQFTAYDRSSIMHYPVPAEFTLDGSAIGWNTDLSQTDISFIRQVYH